MPPNLIHYAIPGFVLLLVAEAMVAAREKADWIEPKDSLTSIGLGLGNVLTGLFTKALVYAAYSLVYQFRLFTLDAGQAWVWALAFVADDFSYYWFHRQSHLVRYFWASHVVHHSSPKYNLASALRQTWTGNLTGAFVFWLWMPLVGFHPAVVLTMQAISLIYQFWIHTEAIGKLWAPAEWVFNTPSHHRAHHGADVKYLDKNYAGVLIVWDRLFSTFKAEEERPRYGLTKNVDSHNPAHIAVHEWVNVARDLRRARSWAHAWGYLTQPPGWSPDGSTQTARQLQEAPRSTPRPE